MFQVKLADVIKNTRKAIQDKTLGAFNNAECQYQSNDGSRCAVGQAMSDDCILEVVSRGLNTKNCMELRNLGLVEFDHFDTISELQSAHDRWAQSAHDPEVVESVKLGCRDSFLFKLDVAERTMKERENEWN